MYEYHATLVRVIDGDTVILDVDLGFHMRGRLTFRLHGVDCPERGQPGALEATKFLTDALDGVPLTIRTHKGQTFGRWLATITPEGAVQSVNDTLIAEGYCKA